MSFVKEFRDFAGRGNVVDMEVGIIIGGAFGNIVASMGGDILRPIVGKLTGGLDFSSMGIVLGEVKDKAGAVITNPSVADAKAVGAAVISYGTFITAVIDFVIIAFVIFVMIQQMNKLKKAAPPPPPPNSHDCPKCLMPIPLKATAA